VIICDDSLEYLLRMRGRGQTVKCIFADVPDNLGLNYEEYGDCLPSNVYYDWLELLIMRSLPCCQIFWLSIFSEHLMEVLSRIRNVIKYYHPLFECRTFIWRYTFGQYNDKDCARGYRPIIRLVRHGAMLNVDSIRELSGRQKLGDARAAGDRVPDDVWHIPRVTGNSIERRAWHPTQHPVKLMKRIVSMSCYLGDTVIDLFGGTGSCLRAARDLGINCISIDKSKKYCDLLIEELGND